MNDDASRTTFMAEFYNYAMHVTNDVDIHKDKKSTIEGLKASINDDYRRSLYTTTHHKPGERGRDGDTGPSGSKRGKRTDVQDAIADALDGLGFEIKDMNDGDYYGPFMKVRVTKEPGLFLYRYRHTVAGECGGGVLSFWESNYCKTSPQRNQRDFSTSKAITRTFSVQSRYPSSRCCRYALGTIDHS